MLLKPQTQNNGRVNSQDTTINEQVVRLVAWEFFIPGGNWTVWCCVTCWITASGIYNEWGGHNLFYI